jgi:hypothetical protein
MMCRDGMHGFLPVDLSRFVKTTYSLN